MSFVPRTPRRVLGAAVGAVLVVLVVVAFWPVQLGGWTSYAVIDGTSMQPGLATGDLIVTRVRGEYGVGDAVLYRSDLLRSKVFHRIVAEENGRFTFRGDNRKENDPEQVTKSAILGAEWFAIPGAGRPVHWLGEPLNLAIVCFVLVLLVLAGGREVTRRRRRRGVDPAPVAVEERPRAPGSAASAVPAGRGLALAGAVSLLAFGAFGAAAWSHGTSTTEEVVGGYAHTGTFSYDAKARRGAVYPDGEVTTGQPVFLKLARAVDVAFDYRFTSDRPVSLRGGIGLDAVLTDGRGWTRTLPITPAGPFEGTLAHVEGRLDLRRVAAIVERLQASTGANVTEAGVAIVPRVTVAGYTGDHALDEAFAPELPFSLDTVALRLVEPRVDAPNVSPDEAATTAASPLTPRSEGSTVVTRPASLALGSLASVDVARARSLSLVGLLASLAALALGGLLLLRRGATSEADRIEARYGSRIVPARATVPEGRWVTELHDVEALIRLAEAYDRVVLRVVEADGGDAFLVDDGIAVYRYRPEPPTPLGTTRTLPAHGR